MSKRIKELNASNYENYLTYINERNTYHDPCLNVLRSDYSPWYLRNWFRNARQFFRNIKYAYQRIVHGYCDRDIWWMDGYIATVFADMLDDLSVNSCGYPGIDAYNTPEAWTKALQAIAYKIRAAQDDNHKYFDNPKEEAWVESWGNHDNSIDAINSKSKLSEDYRAIEQEIAKDQKSIEIEVFHWLEKWYHALWD